MPPLICFIPRLTGDAAAAESEVPSSESEGDENTASTADANDDSGKEEVEESKSDDGSEKKSNGKKKKPKTIKVTKTKTVTDRKRAKLDVVSSFKVIALVKWSWKK